MFEMEGDDASLAPLPTGARTTAESDHLSMGGVEKKEELVLGDGSATSTSPSDSMSSFESDAGAKPVIGRRMSNVSEEEREKARVYREGVMNKGGKSILCFRKKQVLPG